MKYSYLLSFEILFLPMYKFTYLVPENLSLGSYIHQSFNKDQKIIIA